MINQLIRKLRFPYERIALLRINPGIESTFYRLTMLSVSVVIGSIIVPGCQTFRCQPVDAKTALARELTCGGLDAIEKGNQDRGCVLLQRAVEEQPDDHRIRVHLAESLKRRGQTIQAIEQMKAATEIAAHDPELRTKLGNLYLEAGNISEALNQAEHALAIDSRRAEAWALKGMALRRWGRVDEAMAALHRALDYQDEYTDVELELAGIYVDQNRPLRAFSTLEVCRSRFAPGREPEALLIEQGRVLASMKRYDRAVDTIVAATQRQNASPRTFSELARVQIEAGDLSNARLTLASACEKWPNHSGLRSAMLSVPNSSITGTAQNAK